MAFQSFTSIQTVVCPSCQGSGCGECANFGVYALSGDRTLIFSLPGFLDLKKRKKIKIVFLFKRIALLLTGLLFVGFLWSIIGNFT